MPRTGHKKEKVKIAPKTKKTDMPFPVMAREADIDYLMARALHFSDFTFHARAGLFAQMACEKYLKALTIQHDQTYAHRTHKLLDLAKLCEPIDSYFGKKNTKNILEQFDMFDQVGRYGGAAHFDPLSKGKSVGPISVQISPGVQVAGLVYWTPQHLDDLDGFVFKIRSFFDYAKIHWGELLIEITKKKPEWKKVLEKNNRYFKP